MAERAWLKEHDWCDSGWRERFTRGTALFAETWFHRDPFAPLGAPAGNYLLAALGLHARAKSVCLRSLAPVGLECTLGHEKYLLLIRSTVLGQTTSINHFRHYLQTNLSDAGPIFRLNPRRESSREAAKECSPRRKPWGCVESTHKRRRRERKTTPKYPRLFVENQPERSRPLHLPRGSYHRAT
jgi:hypothetical protein